MLGVPVQSSWKACDFACPPFETTLKKLEDIFQLETSIALNSSRTMVPKLADNQIKDDQPQMAAPKIE